MAEKEAFMLKHSGVIAALLILSTITYYLYQNLSMPVEGELQTNALLFAQISLIISIVSFVAAIIGLVKKARESKKLS